MKLPFTVKPNKVTWLINKGVPFLMIMEMHLYLKHGALLFAFDSGL